MKIDVTKVLNKRASTLDFEYDIDLTGVECDVILPEEFTYPEPCRVTGTVKDQNNCMSVEFKVTVKYRTLCDRCLNEMDGELCFELEKTVTTDDLPQGAEDDPTFDDVIAVSESSICLDDAIVEEVALRLPPYHLCKEDCPGLCPRCGKALADGPCGCSEKKEIDPRLKKLQKLLDNFD